MGWIDTYLGSMVSILGRRTDWLERQEVPKFKKGGPADYFDYNYPTNYFWSRLLGPIAKYLVQHFFWIVKVEGVQNVPKNRNIILMPNHLSHADSFFAIANLWPIKPFHAIADEKLFRNKYFLQFAKMFNAFPVRKGSKNLNIVKYAIKRVNNKDNLLWYPEGQRHKNPSENKTYPGKLGTGMLAHAVDAPIVPCLLSGTEFVMPIGQPLKIGKRLRSIEVQVRYGRPVPLEDLRNLPPSVETSQLVVDRIMSHIEELRPKEPYYDQSYKL